ncbi:MAG: IclR family transcriptional regulator C-terminal domain-containing protein, partial [Thermomicrobiales bacterium]
ALGVVLAGLVVVAYWPRSIPAPPTGPISTHPGSFPDPLPSVTPATIVDLVALDEDLARTRARGYALEDEESTPGVRSVAAPVLDARGLPVAALAVTGPVDRIDLAHADRIASRLWRASREVTRRMDGVGAADAIAS